MKIAKMLIDKYWRGISSIKEEKWLKERLAAKEDPSPDAAYFKYLQEKSTESLDDPEFDKAILAAIQDTPTRESKIYAWKHWRVAAAVVLFLAASLMFKVVFTGEYLQSDEVVTVDTYQDPEKALEETKKALMFISTQLNKGSAYTAEFSKFNESQEKLKKE